MHRIVSAMRDIRRSLSLMASNAGLTMPSRTLLALAAAALLGLLIGRVYVPATTMNLEIYPSLADSEFSMFQAEAKRFAEELTCQGVTIGKHDSGAHFFVVSVRTDPILFADNSGPRLLVVTMPAVAGDAMDLQHWKDGWDSPERRKGNLKVPESSCPRFASP